MKPALTSPVAPPPGGRGPFRSYAAGFILSLVLTAAAVSVVVYAGPLRLGGAAAAAAVLVLAVVQMCVQAVFFLHLLDEKGPRWNLVFFASTLSIVLIIVVGSLWIMAHLNYNMMPEQVNAYMRRQGGI